jgi:RNA polymerase sigma-70 factor (ECF subfamily)
MIEDRLLIFGFKRGNRESLRRIYDKYKVELLRLAIVLLGDTSSAEDTVHDVFVNFAQSADRIKLTGSLRSYLVTSVINRVRNYRRDRIRHSQTSLEEADSRLSLDPGPLQWAILDEQLIFLSRALQGLPYEQREVISLHIETDMTFHRIATLQSASLNTVKGRYRYGIERLRSMLNGKVEHEIRR